MSRVACVWAELPDDTDASVWYEDTHIPDVVAKMGITACNTEQAEDNVFKEVAGIDGKYMTLYDLPDAVDASDITRHMSPYVDKLPDARLDIRIYDEYAAWFGEEWCDHTCDIQMFITVLWQPNAAVHDDFVEWFRTNFAPGMLECPELLRIRIFKLQHASICQDGATTEKNAGDMYQYMTIWEFDCDELPWEILVYLGSSEKWRYYVEGGHLQWQITQYLVNRMYPEEEGGYHRASQRASLMVGAEELGSEDGRAL